MSRLILHISVFIISIGMLPIGASAQTGNFIFRNLTQQEGLPSNETYYIFRDSRNYLWIATENGVVRYNGNKMQTFDLPDNAVFKIKEDKAGRIFFFTYTGKLSYFYKEKIYTYPHNDRIKKAIDRIGITDVCVTDTGGLIINSSFGTNLHIDSNGIVVPHQYLQPTAKPTSLRIVPISATTYFAERTSSCFEPNLDSVDVTVVRATGTRKIKFLPTDHGYNHYGCVNDKEGNLFLFAGKDLVKIAPNGKVTVKNFPSRIICLYSNGNEVWVGILKYGLSILNYNLDIVNQPQALINSSVTSITKDYENNIWLSTLEKGVFNLKNSNITVLSGDSVLRQPVFRIANHGDSLLLFATSKGLYIRDKEKIRLLLSKPSYKTSDILVKGQDIFWGGNFPQTPEIFCIRTAGADNRFKSIYTLTANSEIMEIASNRYLVNHVATFSYLSTIPEIKDTVFIIGDRVKGKNSTHFNYMQSMIFQGADKTIYLGNHTGFYQLDTVRKVPIPYRLQSNEILEKGVACARQMPNGYLAAAIRFGGLLIFNDHQQIGLITESEGLLSNSISFILQEGNQLWLATSRGISVVVIDSYTPFRYHIRNIGKNEGLYNTHIYQLLFYQGNLLVASNDGIFQIQHPQEFLHQNMTPIPLSINSISYGNIDTVDASSITLPYNQNKILIKYSGISFSSADEIKYYYKLDKNDTLWNESTTDQLLLENLRSGTYTLQIKAEIPTQQRISTISELQLIIEKPFWEESWFILLSLALVTTCITLIYKHRIKKIREAEAEKTATKTKLVEMEQTALRLQMNPHFIFNCLTSIQQLILIGDKDTANEYLVKFSRMIRQTLVRSESSFITIIDEINYLKDYVHLEQMRQPDQFDFHISVAPDIDTNHIQIPNMMLQPIIENAIRHGINHLNDKKGNILLEISLKQEGLQFVVEDNGIGIDHQLPTKPGIHKSYALDITTKRLALLYQIKDADLHFKIDNLYDTDHCSCGTRVVIVIPLKPGSNENNYH